MSNEHYTVQNDEPCSMCDGLGLIDGTTPYDFCDGIGVRDSESW